MDPEDLLEHLILIRKIRNPPALLEFDLKDGRKIHVQELIHSSARLCLLDGVNSYRDEW